MIMNWIGKNPMKKLWNALDDNDSDENSDDDDTIVPKITIKERIEHIKNDAAQNILDMSEIYSKERIIY